jgi:hypothetical protein
MSDGQSANSLRDGSARCSARHAAALDCAEGAAAERAVALADSGPASVVAAALVVAVDPRSAVPECAVSAAGSDPASVALPVVALYPDSASVAALPVVALCLDSAAVAAGRAVAAYLGSASVAALPVVAVCPDSAAVAAGRAVAASPDSAADHVAVQVWLDPSPFAAGWADLVCLSCSPAHRWVQRFQESTTTQLN